MKKEKPLSKKAILLSSRKLQKDFHPREYDDLLFYFDDVKEAVQRAEKRLKGGFYGWLTEESVDGIINKIWKEEFGRFE